MNIDSLNMEPDAGGVIHKATDALRADISAGRLPPGEKLKVAWVRQTYDISAASAREALSQLCGEGYVDAIEQRGFFVSDMTSEVLLDNTRLRAELESLAFRWSVAHQTPEWRAGIVSSHFLLKEAEAAMLDNPARAIRTWDDRNRAFHMSLIANAGSPALIDLIRDRYDMTRRFRIHAYLRITDSDALRQRLQHSATDHEQIAQAALALDADKGAELLWAHINKPSGAS